MGRSSAENKPEDLPFENYFIIGLSGEKQEM